MTTMERIIALSNERITMAIHYETLDAESNYKRRTRFLAISAELLTLWEVRRAELHATQCRPCQPSARTAYHKKLLDIH